MELQYNQMKWKDLQDIFNKSLDTTEEKMSKLGEIRKKKNYLDWNTQKNKIWKNSSGLWGKIKWSNVYEMEDPEKGGQKIYLKK